MRLRSLWHFGRLTFFLLDCVLLWAAIVCALKVSPRFQQDILDGVRLRPNLAFVGYGMPLFMAAGLQLTGVQRSRSGFHASETIVLTIVGLSLGMLAFSVGHALVQYELVGRYVLIFTMVYGSAFIVGSRLVVWKLAERTSRNVLLYGSRAAHETVESFVRLTRIPIRLLGHTRIVTHVVSVEESALPLAGASLNRYCEKNAVEELVIETPEILSSEERADLLMCTGKGINVVDLSGFFERNFERVYVPALSETWFWSYDPTYAHPVYFAFKRLTDIVVSMLGMLVFAPIAPIVVLIIKLQDGGPAIYSQTRVGLYNAPFRIFKFRTMRIDAEKSGAQWARKGDVRITWFGRVLRKTRIDEVPQFWNILIGNMSFIGPRPERPEFIDLIEKEVLFYRYRHLIKPGLTGWAQVNYPYGASVDDARQKLSYDLYYLKYASATRDMLILLRTMGAMMHGAR